jgi:peroxiredoxin
MCILWPSLLLSALVQPVGFPDGPGCIGSRIADFSLCDHRGHKHQLSDFADRKLVVVVFLGVDCPLAKLYGPRLAEMARTYQDRGVAVLGIDANQNEPLAALARYARDHQIAFPLLCDPGNVVADLFGAKRTPEAFILDPERAIRYRGRIDDQYAVGVQRPTVGRRDLIEALEELLAGKTVSTPRTEAVGCLISRARPPGKGSVTYAKDVAPILERHCQRCHRPGQIAPFALTAYKEVATRSATIREVIELGRMPPWHANPKFGRFANDPSMSDAEKRLLLRWIDGDCPPGDLADLRPMPSFADWNIPQPDAVLSMPRPFIVPAEGTIDYQFVEVDPEFTEDRWVQAAEIRPGNRAVVHHCNVFLKAPGAEGPTEQGALGSFLLAAAAAGTPPVVFPEGIAKRVPAGWRLVFVLHYTPIGLEQTDQTSIALKFADPKSVRKEVATRVMIETELCVPPHEANYQVTQTWQVNREVLLLSMFPHMHLRGKSFRYQAQFPNGDVEVLLDVPSYDFNWQHNYVLAEPRRLPAGTRLRCTALYDNSAANPANPDPSATVRMGPQSWDEMFNGYFDVVLADQDLTQPPSWQERVWTNAACSCRHPLTLTAVLAASLLLIGRRLTAFVARPRPRP